MGGTWAVVEKDSYIKGMTCLLCNLPAKPDDVVFYRVVGQVKVLQHKGCLEAVLSAAPHTSVEKKSKYYQIRDAIRATGDPYLEETVSYG